MKKSTKIKKLVMALLILIIAVSIIIISDGLWNIIDPFNTRTDPAPLVYIMNNSYHSNRYAENIEEERIGVFIGEVKKKTIISPNKNGESNHLEKGTELYEIIGEDLELKIAVKYKDKYYEYVDAPWD